MKRLNKIGIGVLSLLLLNPVNGYAINKWC